MLVLAALALLGSQVHARDCETNIDFYPGFQDCKPRMTWLKSNYKNGNYPWLEQMNGTYCAIQKFLSQETTRDGKPLYACPDPDSVPFNDTIVHLGNGVYSMIVYRNLKFSPDNPWSKRLLNSNGANLPGAFQYLHAEVVPESQRTEPDRRDKTRRFGINAIIAFNVTFKNKNGGSQMGGFVAFDAGQCTAGAACPNWNSGFFIGVQAGDTTRTKYMGAKWMSFPQCGFCDWPTGEPNCTYTYSVVGKYDIDQMVMGKTPATEASTLNQGLKMADGSFLNLEPRTYQNLMDQGKFEWQRSKDVCPVTTVSGLEFWKDPCDEFKCKIRMQRAMFAGVMDTSVAGPGEGPAPGTCIPPSAAPTLPPTPPPSPAPSTPAIVPTIPPVTPSANPPTSVSSPTSPTAVASPTEAAAPTNTAAPTPATQTITDGASSSSRDDAAIWVPVLVIILALALGFGGYVMWKRKFHKAHAYLMTDLDPLDGLGYQPPSQPPQQFRV